MIGKDEIEKIKEDGINSEMKKHLAIKVASARDILLKSTDGADLANLEKSLSQVSDLLAEAVQLFQEIQ